MARLLWAQKEAGTRKILQTSMQEPRAGDECLTFISRHKGGAKLKSLTELEEGTGHIIRPSEGQGSICCLER